MAVRVGVGLDLEQLLVRDGRRDGHVPRDVIAGQLAMARVITPGVLTGEGFTVVQLDAAGAPASVANAPAACTARLAPAARVRQAAQVVRMVGASDGVVTPGVSAPSSASVVIAGSSRSRHAPGRTARGRCCRCRAR